MWKQDKYVKIGTFFHKPNGKSLVESIRSSLFHIYPFSSSLDYTQSDRDRDYGYSVNGDAYTF